MSGCPRVFHVAGFVSYRRRDAERLYQSNVVGTHNVLGAALEAGVERVVHTSSTAAVGLSDEPNVLDESAPFGARFRAIPYMWMKHLAEVEVAEAVAAGLDVVIVNPSTIIGGGDVNLNAGRLFRQIARGAVRAAPPGGNSVVSLDDVVSGHLLAMERGRNGRRYILNAENLPHREMLSRIAAAFGRAPIERELPRWTEKPLSMATAVTSRLTRSALTPQVVFFSYRYRYFSAARAHAELGWRPITSLDASIAEAIRWYEASGTLGTGPREPRLALRTSL